MTTEEVAVTAVIPAAGGSTRMGRDKLLLPWKEGVVIGSVVEALGAGGAEAVVVVIPPDNPSLRSWVEASSCLLAVNPRPERGMLSSVVVGLGRLGERRELVGSSLLVCPGDHAGLAPSTVRALCQALVAGAAIAVPVFRGVRGHPLAISHRLVGEIPSLDDGVGLRQLLERHRHEVFEVEVSDPAAVRDLDTPADYQAAVE